MKTLYFISFALLIYACNSDSEINPTENVPINWRTLPTYNLSYQYPSGYIEAETSNDLTNWSSGVSTGVSSLYGTSSTLYDYAIPDNHRRWLVAYQNSSNQLLSTEFIDGGSSWTVPSSINSTTSSYLPTVEYNDGVVDEAHCGAVEGSSQYVKSSHKTAATSWSTSAYLYYSSGASFLKIPTNFSPCLEFHQSAWVEYLVTVVISGGATVPGVYWRSGSSIFNYTNSPSITIGTSSPSERNSSLCAVALNDGSDDLLYIFYTDPGESTSSDKEIKFVKSPPITGGGDGTISAGSYSSPVTISGAYTNNKIDGFFDYTNDLLVIIFRNANTGFVDVAFSDDYGSTWDLSITNIVSASGAPSIAPRF